MMISLHARKSQHGDFDSVCHAHSSYVQHECHMFYFICCKVAILGCKGGRSTGFGCQTDWLVGWLDAAVGLNSAPRRSFTISSVCDGKMTFEGMRGKKIEND